MKFGSSRDLIEERPVAAVRLEVRDGDDLIVCRVSREALEALVSRDGSEPGELLSIAHNYFELLTDKWMDRIQLGRSELDGSILLRRQDVI